MYMRFLRKFLFGVVVLIFVISLFQFSWEIGLSSLVLIAATWCIWLVLKKITTVVVRPELLFSSEPFRDSGKNGKNAGISVNQKTAVENLIPGVDGSVFEQFRENLNFTPTPRTSAGPTPSSANTSNSSFVADAYGKANSTNDPENFSEELDEVEQVKVTLSKNAKTLQQEQNAGTAEDGVEELREDATWNPSENVVEGLNERVPEKPITNNREKGETDGKLGAGEEALEILSRKHQELRRQTKDQKMEPLVKYDEDLFADELIPLPGGESLFEPEKGGFNDLDPLASQSATDSLDDEEVLGSSLRKNTPLYEKTAEAEGLLKLATASCEAGRLEESRASLESYLDLLKELVQEPSPNVMHLAEKLDIPLGSTKTRAFASNTEETKTGTTRELEKTLRDEPEQTNYANVMDGIVKTLEDKESYDEALPLLKDLLKYNRQRVNISAMDPLFDRIERALSSLKNDEDLVVTYKEHLAIKQQLGDIEGELDLLDLISTYYANLGDLKASERYQAESLRVKAGLEYKKAIEEEETGR